VNGGNDKNQPGNAVVKALKALFLAGALAGAFALSARAAEAPDLARVATGALHGALDGDVVSFKAIPYAAAPVGDLRWRAPRPAPAWSGVRAADKYGAICTQRYDPKDNGTGALPMSEDCLTVNVWRPVSGPRHGLPAMVWIHGGGFVNGSGAAPLYDGTQLARQGVVVVTLNYRLGRFGFFAHPALTRESPDGPLANYGLMDQIAALRWVKANIAAFGGDPNAITVFGESAGGISVNNLMVSPAARGLFVRAIVESGAGRNESLHMRAPNILGAAGAEDQGVAFAKALGVTTDDPAVLRAIPAEKIIAQPDFSPFTGGVAIDGKIVTMDVDEGFAQGAEAKVPYIIGSNGLEFPLPAAQVDAALGAMLHVSAPARAGLEAAYNDKAAFQQQVFSDIIFSEPARHLAALHARHGQPTFLYRFTAMSPAIRGVLHGAPHASERQYVFKTLHASTWPTGGNDPAIADAMSAYWVSFAKTSDPNGGGRPAWPDYRNAPNRLLDFTNDGPVAGDIPHPERLDAIASGYPAGR
jgi:para-nitrobenzyl esterase